MMAEKVSGDRGDLHLTTSFMPFVKFNTAAVDHRILLEGCFFLLMGVFQRTRRSERQRTHRRWVREIFQIDRLPAVPSGIVKRAREIAELKSRKLERTNQSLLVYFSLLQSRRAMRFRLFRAPSRLPRKGLLAVYPEEGILVFCCRERSASWCFCCHYDR